MIHKIHKRIATQRGFIATTAVIILTMGCLAFSTAALSAVIFYSDSIERREWRIQRSLNQEACSDTVQIMKAKDYFWNGTIELSEFDCAVN